MRLIRKGTEPPLLLAYRKTEGASYDGLPGEAKRELRSALVSEQLGLCCFCMQRIGDAVQPTLKAKVAHRVPRAVDVGRELDWANLHAACLGNEGAPRDQQHCDTRQGAKVLTISPAEPTHVETLSYRVDGAVETSRDDLRDDLEESLNLNVSFLRRNRRAARDAMFEAMQREKPAKKFSGKQLEKWLEHATKPVGGALPPFAGVLEFWLRKRLGRKR